MISIETFGQPVDQQFIARVLAPYRNGCGYLQRAVTRFEGAQEEFEGWGEFAIPSSFYIQSTGHFNAVEFVLCFNQLGYLLLAEAARQGKSVLTLESFFSQQLPNVVIVDLATEFFRPIDAARFFGHFRLRSVTVKRRRVYFGIDVDFFDGHGGEARGRGLVSCYVPVVSAETASARIAPSAPHRLDRNQPAHSA